MIDIETLINVSIPRSEFWSFGRRQRLGCGAFYASFNSSVGILVVRTPMTGLFPPWLRRFNSSVGILVVRTQNQTLFLQM